MKQKFYRFLMPVVFAQQILYGPPSMREPTTAEKINSVFNIVLGMYYELQLFLQTLRQQCRSENISRPVVDS